MPELQWEVVKQNTGGTGRLRRAQVPGGWLVSHTARDESTTMFFLPDGGHGWDVEIEGEGALPAGRGWDKR